MLRFLLSILFLFQLNPYTKAQNDCGQLFLTVNAVTNKLEMNWDFTPNCAENPPQLINLIRVNDDTSRDILQTISVRSSPVGYQLSEVEFGNPRFPGNWNEDDEDPPVLSSHCYPYLMQSVRGDAPVDEACLKIEPTWMEEFGPLRVGKLVIPGTHDSGAGAWNGNQEGLIERYSYAQGSNLWSQLVSGIRYFDIGVGYFVNMNPNLFINNGDIYCSIMQEEFRHIGNFLRKSPQEVVVLHINSFHFPEEFTDEHHQLVLALLQTEFADFLLPREQFTDPEGPTLQEIWDNDPNKRLIVSYNEDQYVQENPWLWYNIKHKVGEVLTGIDLYNFVNQAKSDHDHPNSPFCALIGSLIPTMGHIIQNTDKSLKHMADEVNPEVSIWMGLAGWIEEINIVATDFFAGTNIVDISIKANRNQLSNANNNNN